MKKHPATIAIHEGETHKNGDISSIPPIHLTTTFLADPDAPFSAENLDDSRPFVYTRWGNPTVHLLEEKLAALENGEAALAFGSGIAAVTGLFLYKLKPGDRVLVSDISYAGVREFCNQFLVDFHVEVVTVNMSDLDALEAELKKGAKLVFAETPCNPILRLTDIEQAASLSHQYGAQFAVDSTFASPIITRPLELGADFVIHSLTKYISGHGDALGGAVIGAKDEIAKLKQSVLIHHGAVMSPFNAYLINRGLATLPIRMKQHSLNANRLATYLEHHPNTKRVIYPGLPSHPQFELGQTQMLMPSGMITMQVDDPKKILSRVKESFETVHYAVSLGHHKTLMFYLSTEEMQASSFKMNPAQMEDYRRYAGDGVFRISVGLEYVDDVVKDFERLLR